MIKEVDDLLWQWAEWVDRRESNALGYQMSTLNGQMAAACTEHPSGSPRGVEGRIEELMSLVDVVLCQMVTPSSKAVIDRYYRSRVGGEVAAASLVTRPKRRADAFTVNIASEYGVTRETIRVWVHNAHVELQKAMESLKSKVRQVGVMGVVCSMQSVPVAANDESA